MKILITGASGYIGTLLSKALKKDGHEVFAFNRKEWPAELPLFDLVINLAGENLSRHLFWTKSVQQRLFDSRVLFTRRLVTLLQKNNSKTPFISASATAVYGPSCFIKDLCTSWEEEAQKHAGKTTIMRLGVVVGKGSEFSKRLKMASKLPVLLLPYKGENHLPIILEEELSSLVLQNMKCDRPLLEAFSKSPKVRELISKTSWPLILNFPVSLFKFFLGEASALFLIDYKKK